MKRFSLSLLLLLMPGLTVPVQAFVHASGGTIVDSQGNATLQRGMGLGGWLVPEGYMLKFPGFGSPSSIRASIVDLIGTAAADSFYTLYRSNYVTQADIQQLAQWGFDHIRLPFHYQDISPRRGVWDSTGFALFDTVVAWSRGAGMHVVLDMHCAPGGQNGGNISDSDGTARLWLADSNKAHTIEIWHALAQHFAANEWVAGYDLINEPVLPDGISTSDLRAFYMDLTSAIRSVDPNHLIFVEGNWYATDFSGLTPPWDTNMAYSFHKYWNINEEASIQRFLNLRSSNDVPLWMGESGENSNTWFHDAVSLFQANQIGWCWWTHKKFETITSPYSAPMPPEMQAVIAYWNGNAARPTAAEATVALMAFANNLRTDNCISRPGIISALFNPEFGDTHWPVTVHSLPGTILAADYDIGRQGRAYSDADYQNTAWDNYTPWNRGYVYRNDGVDLESGVGSVPHVGWTEAAEWIKYTLEVPFNGVFDLLVEVASPQSGGILQLYLDNTPLGTALAIPQSGGWQNWTEISLEDQVISAGVHVLRVLVVSAGFNFRSFIFTIDTSLTAEQFPRRFTLHQNYPNPFNGSTRIPIESQNIDQLLLEIFDIQGHRIQRNTLIPQNETLIEYVWSGLDTTGRALGAGIYFVKVSSAGESQIRKIILLR